MVYINVVGHNPITLDCHKNSINGEYFRLVIDPSTKEIVEKPNKCDIDVNTAYSHIFGYLMRGEPLPKHTVSEWG